MDIENITKELEKIEGSKEFKGAISKLIDLKSNANMKEVLIAIEKLDHKLDISIGAVNSKIDNMKWFIGIAIAVVAALAKVFKLF
jgi:hypothetical protein